MLERVHGMICSFMNLVGGLTFSEAEINHEDAIC